MHNAPDNPRILQASYHFIALINILIITEFHKISILKHKSFQQRTGRNVFALKNSEGRNS